MNDQIIDLSDYMPEQPGDETFAVYGGEGERARLALPVWRAICLVDGERGGIVWTEAGSSKVRPFFVLDLASDPPRTDFGGDAAQLLGGRDAPSVEVTEGAVTVLLARTPERNWLLWVVGENVGKPPPTSRKREDLLFLAGECAGLILHRELGRAAEE